MSNGSLVPSTTGSRSSDTSSSRTRCEASLVARAQRPRLAARETHELDAPARRIADRYSDAGDVRKALLPDRVLDDDGHDVPAARDRVEPRLGRRRREEVRDDEDEGARPQVAVQATEKRARLDEIVLGRVERRGRLSLLHEPWDVAASGRQPVLLSAAEVERRDVRARGDRARHQGRGHLCDRARLRQPRQRLVVDAHRGPRSQTTTTRGASSAAWSRTMNSSRPVAAETRALANQSIVDDRVADLVRPRADHVAAVATPAGSAGRRTEARRAAYAGRVETAGARVQATVKRYRYCWERIGGCATTTITSTSWQLGLGIGHYGDSQPLV